MTKDKDIPTIGAVIGRFQIDELHDGHKALLQYPIDKYDVDTLIVFIGVTGIGPTKNDPLEFQTRHQMVMQWFDEEFDGAGKTLHIFPIVDLPNQDQMWAANVDRLISAIAGTGACSQSVTIFGGRDSALSTYVKAGGRYNTETIEQQDVGGLSATARREQIGKSYSRLTDEGLSWENERNSRYFRLGCIYTTQKLYDKCFPAVDVAVYQLVYDHLSVCTGFRLVLGTKNDGQGSRFPGGFVDPHYDESLESAAKREMQEELGLDVNVDKPVYVTSCKINDGRYKSQRDKIMSSLFTFRYLWGDITAADDLATAEWHDFSFSDEKPEQRIAANHRQMFTTLFNQLKSNYNGSFSPTNPQD